MNSLLQTLYMTPEFRAALYKLDLDKEDHADDHSATGLGKQAAIDAAKAATASPASAPAAEKKDPRAIPRELQRLFARLQLCDVRAVKTKELTKSFGWKDADAFTQHDVQELCRVLFDALERVLKGTDMATLINDLYQGEMKDYVQCKECGNESSRTDKYLDIPLVIKPFGERNALRSVQEALGRFVQPELLEGDNQYLCTKCNKKVDAKKGLKLLSVPYLLMLQLKRFDFDYETMQRIKLNDRVEFPLTLDMNPFLDDPQKTSQAEAGVATLALSDDKMSVDAPEGRKRKMSDDARNPAPAPAAGAATPAPAAGSAASEPAPTAAPAAAADEAPKQKGPAVGLLDTPRRAGLAGKPNIYELYSILIHRGSSMAGHYYAYIRSFETGRWYEFNDSSVSEINLAEIEKAFGDDDRSSYWNRGANAYMLMYRRLDPARNMNLVTMDAIGERLRRRIAEENDLQKAKEEAKDKERELIRVKLVSESGDERNLQLHKLLTMTQVKAEALKAFGLEGKLELDCMRIRKWESQGDVPSTPYADEITIEGTDSYWKEFYVETKTKDQPWAAYNPTDFTIKAIHWNQKENKWDAAALLNISSEATLLQLKELFRDRYGVPVEKQMVVRELPSTSSHLGRILWDDPKQLSAMHVGIGSRIYVEFCENPNDEGVVPRSKDEIERRRNLLEVMFNPLDSKEHTLKLVIDKRMKLPDLKAMMATVLGLPADQFKVMRGYDAWATELRSETDSLEQMHLMDGSRLTVERGRPTRANEAKVSVYLYQPLLPLDTPPAPDQKEDKLVQLFDVAVEEEMKVSEFASFLAAQMKEQKQLEFNPALLRIREYSTMHRMPLKVYPHSATLRDCMSTSYSYSSRAVAVQPLSAPDTVTSVSDLCLFLVQWKPSKFELGPRGEIVVPVSTTAADLKKMLRERFNVQNPGIGGRTSYSPPDILDLPEFEFDRIRPEEEAHLRLNSTPWYVRDGEYITWRDNDEPLKELTPEEKTKMRRAAAASRSKMYGKEKALHIDT